MTHGNADYQDLFIEHFREAGGGLEYEYRGGWYPADVRTEVLNCKGHEELVIEVVITRHGRIVAGNPRDGIGLAFSHTGTNGPTKWMDSVLDILRAGDADELEQAVKEWTEPVNNYMYCDTKGNFGYRLRGRIPIRDVANTWAPVDATSGIYEWEREIPWEELPHIRNPEVGYAVTCNQKVTTDEYPYHINHFFANEWRARRITNRIKDVPKGEMNVASMGAIHGDRISIPAKWVADRVATLDLSDARAREAQALLSVWDGEMGRDDVEPTISAEVMSHVQWEIATHLFGPMVDEVLAGTGRGGPSHWGELVSHVWESLKDDDDEFLPADRTWDEVLEDAMSGAVEELTGLLGPDMSGWVWGKVHHTKPVHPLSATFPDTNGVLDPPEIPMGGGIDTPQAGSFSQGNKYVITGLSVNRYIHDPSDWKNSKWVSPLGASGHPGSPHYADQAPIWGEVDYVPQLWDWDEIAARAETTQELSPG
jgi:penicillin amidase